jgi:hypothetical protein
VDYDQYQVLLGVSFIRIVNGDHSGQCNFAQEKKLQIIKSLQGGIFFVTLGAKRFCECRIEKAELFVTSYLRTVTDFLFPAIFM